jgi:hypothetical protein
MPMLTEELDLVISVNPHKHTHTAAAGTWTGAVLERVTVPADLQGYRAVMAFVVYTG